ncbi:tetratricopeptide repeat protein [Leptolyngbya sp. 7M]|uniref:tetratricopeptide repeat protein n=1 Tax=Leptolyngbya sp. 7M TaxID=2812896 RepID=UPI001B8CD8A9|nr:tetratricopeptide repeat protein [Leptolyngbya sp. 7M]QYO66257.1 tetratricopeptide repeat protein [Leptolyngbya sp. 7M]
MRKIPIILFVVVMMFTVSSFTSGQVDDFCGEFGFIATLDAPRLSSPFVYGRIVTRGADPASRLPKISITYQNRTQSPERITVGRSGNYCFKITAGSGGVLVVEVDGVEVARRQVATFGTAQQREDFDISADAVKRPSITGVVSSKFYRPPNKRTVDAYARAAQAERSKDVNGVIKYLKEIVNLDPEDYIAWGMLAGKYLENSDLDAAESALRKALQIRSDYTPAWITAARVRMARKQFEAAIEVLKHTITLEPETARAFQLLGESYLQLKLGSLGAEALNKAIELDPIGMAECHLQLAHLYQLANANKMAAEEYKKFLEKIPSHPQRKTFEKFIIENF